MSTKKNQILDSPRFKRTIFLLLLALAAVTWYGDTPDEAVTRILIFTALIYYFWTTARK